MMEPAEHRDSRHRAVALDRSRAGWWLERQRSVRAGGLGERDLLGHDAAQMPLAEWNDLVEALPPQRAGPAFGDRVRLGARIGIRTVPMPRRLARATQSRP